MHGRGVFCASDIRVADVIEVAPVLALDKMTLESLRDTILYEYYFLWGEKQDYAALALGFGSLYNHSATPNATFMPNFEDDSLVFVALDQISAGEEITIDFHEGKPGTPVWFDVKE